MYSFRIFLFGLSFFVILIPSNSIKFLFGDCPVYFYEPCTPDTVRFYLSIKSQNGTTEVSELNILKPELPQYFNELMPLKIVVHGYGGLSVDSSTTNVTKAYQDVGYNVIIVDWEPLAQIPCYHTAYLNTWHVGQCLSLLVLSLIPLGIGPDITHVVGFSLGAHISGLTGNNIKNAVGRSFYRITGLDPALPFFATLKNDWKLDKNDADFVDVIHTSAGTFGKLEATGHVDFYVNGGSLQPFCYSRPYPPLCSHIMAGLYFAESIRTSVFGGKHFVGRKCENVAGYMLGLCNGQGTKTAVMGESTFITTRGKYYLETAHSQPFALGWNPTFYKTDVIKKNKKKFKSLGSIFDSLKFSLL